MPTTITGYNSFTSGTRIKSAEVNTNFSNHRGTLLPINTDTATASDLIHDLGTFEYSWRRIHHQESVFNDTTTPANPTAGHYKLYFKSDGNIYKLNSSGTETQVDAAASALFVTSTSSDYTLTTSVDVLLVNASGATKTAFLFAASGNSGIEVVVKKTDSSSNPVIIDGSGAETIDGATTYSLTVQYESVRLICDGSNWHIT